MIVYLLYFVAYITGITALIGVIIAHVQAGTADPVTNTPAFKETSVHMNVLAEVGESPLPRNNSRFGHPTPQNGVEVQRKWKRPDYHQPGNGLVQIESRK